MQRHVSTKGGTRRKSPELKLLVWIAGAKFKIARLRHGIERNEGSGEIRFAALREGTDLLLRVSDNGPGLRAEGGGGSGIGLANTRARLRELHGDAASLRLADRPGGGSEVEIRLPWRTAAD